MRLRVLSVAVPLLIAAVTVASFWPVLDNGFVDWGDEREIVGYADMLGLAPSNLNWMFTTIQMGHYQPLTWLSFAIDHQLWGLNPAGYHLTSLILHAACTVATYFLIRMLLKAAYYRSETAVMVCAAAGALLFALHPLRVESVAWASERRGLLSALFFMVAVIFYVRYAAGAGGSVPLPAAPAEGSADDTGRPTLRGEGHANTALPSAFAAGSGTRPAPAQRRYLWLSVAMFALSLLAKELSLTLPAVLLLLDVYPLGRLRRTHRQTMGRVAQSLLIEKWPFVALSGAWAVIAALSAAQSGVVRPLADHGLSQRLAQALYGLAFYPAKSLIPTDFSNLYWIPRAMNPFELRFIVSAMAVAAITVALVLLRKRFPAGITAWPCFAILIAPVLGLVQTGHQLVADRYSYQPAVALSAVAAGLMVTAWQRSGENRVFQSALVLGVLAALVGLTIVSRDQIRVWKDSQTLWSHAVDVEPGNAIAHNNLGAVLARQGKSQEAIEQFTLAIELDDGYAAAHRNRQKMLGQAGTD